MKKLMYFIIAIVCTLNLNAQIKVSSSGNIGIGNYSPAYKLDIEGSMRISNWTDIIFDWSGACCSTPVMYPENDWYLQLGKANKRVGTIFVSGIHYGTMWADSDEKLKENIDTLENPMPKIMKVHGYHYNFKESTAKSMPPLAKTTYTKKQIGFLAQELDKEFPELVYKPDSVRDTYGVNYVGMVPVLLEGLKYQQKQIESLQKLTISQEQDILELKKQVAAIKNTGSKIKSATVSDVEAVTSTDTGVMLYQNTPNPFNQTAEVRFYITESVKSASLYIFNMQGIMIKNIAIATRNSGSITINGSELVAGIYLYTLVADGKEIDTKRMILTN